MLSNEIEIELKEIQEKVNKMQSYTIRQYFNEIDLDFIKESAENDSIKLKKEIFLDIMCQYSKDCLIKLFSEKRSCKIIESIRVDLLELFCKRYDIDFEKVQNFDFEKAKYNYSFEDDILDLQYFLDDGYFVDFFGFIPKICTYDKQNLYKIYFKECFEFVDFSELIQVLYNDRYYITTFKDNGNFVGYMQEIDKYINAICKGCEIV